MFKIKMPWTARKERLEREERERKEAIRMSTVRSLADRRARYKARLSAPPIEYSSVQMPIATSEVSVHWIPDPIVVDLSRSEAPFTGAGGSFDGGGASGDWAATASASAPDSSGSSSDSSSCSSDSSSSGGGD